MINLITTENNKVRAEAEEGGATCAIEFFKIRFPEKIDGDGKCWDMGYLEEWAHRFANGSSWARADNASRLALIELHNRGYITLYVEVER